MLAGWWSGGTLATTRRFMEERVRSSATTAWRGLASSPRLDVHFTPPLHSLWIPVKRLNDTPPPHTHLTRTISRDQQEKGIFVPCHSSSEGPRLTPRSSLSTKKGHLLR